MSTTRTSLAPLRRWGWGHLLHAIDTPSHDYFFFSISFPLSSHAHAHVHAHNPLSSTFAVALCLSLTSRIFQIWFLFVLPRLLSLLLLLSTTLLADADCHMEIFEISRGEGVAEEQPTSGYYNSVYSYLSSGHSTVVSAPSASFSCSRSSSSFLSFLPSLFGKLTWNVLACILVHMCSGIRAARGTPLAVWENYKFPLSEKSYKLLCLHRLQHLLDVVVPTRVEEQEEELLLLLLLAKGFDIKIWWHVVISAPCRCRCGCRCCPCCPRHPFAIRLSQSLPPLDSIPFAWLRFHSMRCDAIRFHSILHPSSWSLEGQWQCQCRQKRKRLMHSCNFLWPITCCKLANLGTLAESIKNKSYWQIHLNLLCPACRRPLPLPRSTFLPSLSSDPSCPCLNPSPLPLK